jgi:hypothetical protein
MTPEQAEKIARDHRTAWRASFGGGVIPFDTAYFERLKEGDAPGIAAGVACQVLLDKYTEVLIAKLKETEC